MAQTRTQPTAFVRDVDGAWLSFRDPAYVLVAPTFDDVRGVIAEVERRTREQKLHAVGFLTYEAGEAFGVAGRVDPSGFPLAWFALFEPDRVVNGTNLSSTGSYELGALTPTIDATAFRSAFETVKEHLGAGDSYQANFTFKLRGPFSGDAAALFFDLAEAQRGRYAVFIDLGDWAVCSASPELFFKLDGLDIVMRPMKGTVPRGLTIDGDRRQAEALRSSEKQQAENVMIVDMVRNDLGRIADVGSVDVRGLFSLERYPNVWQMTSTVSARTRAGLEEIFAALHPSASVTGAPKVRTMAILRDLEPEPRGVYTGALGYIPPDGNAVFNVAIRTAVVDRRHRSVSFGVGSGIVWDSKADDEYAECLLKGRVLGMRPEPFDLLETLRWDPGTGFLVLDRHLQRLAGSAEYFATPFDQDAVKAALTRAVDGATVAQRVRLLMSSSGAVRAECTPHEATPGPLTITLAAQPIDLSSVWLYHKTTNRRFYDEQRQGAAMPCDDVLMWNSRGEVTETTVANIVAEMNGVLVTPPVSSGLLAGTYRAELLARGEVTEAIVRVADLARASRLWVVNSVHEMRPAILRK